MYLDFHVLTQQFFFAERVLGLSSDYVHRAFLQLALDGSEQNEQGLPHVFLTHKQAWTGTHKTASELATPLSLF